MSSKSRHYKLPNESATMALAVALQGELPRTFAGWTLLLEGDLGAGKSTFARALIRGLGHTGPVPSPTYTLVEPYQLSRGTVYHVDLYRIAGADELHFLGWSELDDGLRIIEWPERLPGLAALADIRLRLDYDQSGRTAELQGLSARAGEVLEGVPDRLSETPSDHTE